MASRRAKVVSSLILLGLELMVQGVEDKAFFMKQGQEELERAKKVKPIQGVAKNVILFLGDGMGISTITAARIYKGQMLGQRGEEYRLNMEKLPNAAFSKTYSADRQTSASASTAAAIMSGVKVNFGTMGFDARVLRYDCTSVRQNPDARLETILDWSLEKGKSVGLVTTARLTHASPAASYAHTANRNWERYRDMKTLNDKCVPDIATQLIHNNSNINVILGGGRRAFHNREDNINLIDDWKSMKSSNSRAHYVSNATAFRNINAANTDFLLGLFSESHMDFELHRKPDEQPSLSEMTRTAINILKKNRDQGYFLFVEGARIDHGHHDNWAKRALRDTIAFDDAVGVAREMIGDDTLLIVTADHSHPFNIQGYPKRGNPILGLADPVDPGQETKDGKPYSTLNYANGPGPSRALNLSTVNTSADDFQFPIQVPFADEWETHSGEDVAIFAAGPMAHLFHGVHEQNYIAHVMGYASCVGPNRENNCVTGGAERASRGNLGMMLMGMMMVGFAMSRELRLTVF